ncbi:MULTISPECIES: nicotinate (nicotinamide) nucleotide adenylyltransferase [Caproicibacterium]|jgi:nicotinate-nucleotide adenylyltransferase|uniref:Probable nicotinate-nucleotide adenylyltransferase n=1 Tax=Caproicibacterium lactatifermentans TaxID=2666138 RepID=A0A859DQZ7_9FIRM|nr:nicotinate (nicotinamide) nucleotide adenylyltransferase [Caproicibacterium lactatifermentans]ARP50404.1 nicotinate (nicotinamide) nucleotide adenylyltransferase [Ruminococcaceae bacterium CPB6]QKN23875.1 nicotinate (nicotinamide) nucleotide adenylyltransferase [Caproicibacterium lactatifermentans]QKO31055.1 nicotinate (nicotinamide) nucleotide adenylyltransferase [Caproicibacterium lactatifermentans]
MDKLLVYGGTFNPIHNGHLHLASAFEKITEAERVLLIPTRVPPHKEAPNLISGEQRFDMCQLAVQRRGWQVSDMELRRLAPSYTSDTLTELAQENPNTKLYFLTGEDMFLTLFSWHDPQCILRLATVCAAPRSLTGMDKMLDFADKIREAGGHALVRNVRYLPVSSTQVRARVRAGKDVHALVPSAVESYIAQNSLYREPMKT